MTDIDHAAVRAVILCAGRGSRLGALTQAAPKSLTVLAGRSLLEWKLRALRAAGIQEVHVLTGYAAAAFADLGIPCIHNDRWATTNMVATLTCAHAVMERAGRTLVCYGDVVFHPDVVRALLCITGDIVVPYDSAWRSLWEARFSDPTSDAESFSQREGRLLDIGKRVDRVDDVQGQFMGLWSVTQRGWLEIVQVLGALPAATVDGMDTTTLLSRLIAAGCAIHTVAVSGRWCEVDSQRDLTLYRERLENANWAHDWRWESSI